MNSDKLDWKYGEKSTDPMKHGICQVVVTFSPTDIQSGQDLYVKLATTPYNQEIPNHIIRTT